MTLELYHLMSYHRTASAGQPWNSWLMVLHATLHHWRKACYAEHPHHPPAPHLLQSDLHHSNFFCGLPPAIFFNFIASSWRDVRSPLLAAIHLSGRCAASPIAAEVRSNGYGTYRAHAGAEFPVYGYIPKPNAINLQLLSHPTVFYFHPGCYSLGNRKDQQFGPCLRLSQR